MQAFGTQLSGSSEQLRRAGRLWWAWLSFVVALTILIGLVMLIGGPTPAIIGWILYFAGMAAIVLQPRYGLYLVVFLSLAGDNVLMPWYPFNKNFSSPESLFHIQSDAFIISPLETYLLLTLASWLLRAILRRELNFRGGPLFGAAAVFAGFVLFGLVWGIARGGNVTIALWEVRPILYLPLMLVLSTNLIDKSEHANILIWLAMAALFIIAVVGIWYYWTVLDGASSRVEWLVEHGAAVRLNTLFVLALAAFVYRSSRAKRLVLPLMLPLALYFYVLAQRRAAFIGLAVAFLLVLLLLFKENRRVFWRVAPPVVLFSLMYLAAFWNNQGMLGLPARAVRTVFSLSSGNFQEDASNYYRLIENVNIDFTIHRAPLTGVGFGHPFYIIAPLPDISFFEWWQYITHNSIAWIWMETGVGGFVSLIFLVGLAIMTGVRLLGSMRASGAYSPDMSAIVLTATLYIVMHFLYAYVDMSWDIQSMIFMGLMMGLINGLPWIAGVRAGPHAIGTGVHGAPASGSRWGTP